MERVTVRARRGIEELELSGRYLVGCDGAHSATREWLGLSLVGKTYKARVLIADVTLKSNNALPTPRIAINAKGPLVLLRFDETRWRVVGTLEPGETEEHARSVDGVAARLRLLAGAAPFDLLWSSTFQIHNRVVDAMRANRILLAGDAAHLSSPAGGMGMNSGIEDAHNLAWKLADVLAGKDDSLLDTYETERLYAIKHAVERTSDVASNTLYFAPWPLRATFMVLFKVAMTIPPVRRRMLTAMSMLATRYPPSKIVAGDMRWAGRIAPDCEIGVARSEHLFDGRMGRAVLVCYEFVPWTDSLGIDVVHVAATQGRAFRRTWRVRRPFCALVRPDGFIGWAKERPSHQDLTSVLQRWKRHERFEPQAASEN